MKICPYCQNTIDDDCMFCTKCGHNLNVQQQNKYDPYQPAGAMPGQQPYGNPMPPYQSDPFDHTAEFDPQDISDNKVFAMLPYLMGAVGVVIILLLNNHSKYAQFHLRQGTKFMVVNILLGLATTLLFWTLIVPVAGSVMALVLLVIRIICFVQVCKGQAKDAAIIRSLDFLK